MFTILRNITTPKWLIASAAALAIAVPSLAQPRDNHDDHFDHRAVDWRAVDRHDRDWHFDFALPFFNVTVGDCAPVAAVVPAPPVDRVWVAPVYQTAVQNVWVPDQFEPRPVTFYDHGRRWTRIDQVLVVSGHFEARQTQLLVSEGHWETCDPQPPINGN